MSNVECNDFAALAQARQLWTDGHAEQAFVAFDQAIEAHPRNVLARIDFAEVMGRCFQIEFAEELLECAEALALNVPHVLSRVARAYDRIRRPRKAIEILEGLRNRKAASPLELGELSLLYEKFNQLEEAYAAICECVEQAPEQAEPMLILARILRLRGESERAEQVLQNLVAVNDVAPLLHVRAWTEICLLRDHQGDYSGAIQAIDNARSSQRQFPEVERLQRRNRAISHALRSVYAQIDDGTIQRWSLPNMALDQECGGVSHLLGFPRAGTTLLEQILDAHPGIVSSPEQAVFTDQIFPLMCQLKDARVLSFQALNAISVDQLTLLRELYLDGHQSIQGQSLEGRILLDKNPNHTPLIAGLFRLFPESRFIFALRDPRDVIISNYLRYFPLNEFSSAFLTWESTVQQYVNDMNIWLRMRELLRDNWIEVRYEDTVSDMKMQACRALTLCDLEWDDMVGDYRDGRQNHLVNSPSRAEVVQPIYTRAIGRWRNYEQCIEPCFDRLSPILDAFGYS